MKTTAFNFSLIVAFTILSFTKINAAVIHSTATGGPWGDASTWVEGIVPEAGDIVFISSPSTVYIGHVVGYDIYPSYCDQITIENNAILMAPEYGGGTGTFKLYVTGDLINNGTITNGSEVVNIILSGNLTNNGSYGPYETEFNGTSNQNLTLGNGLSIGGGIIYTGTAALTSTTDLIYDGLITTINSNLIGDFNLNGTTLHMGTQSIKSSGTLIYGGIIEGDFEILGTFSVSKYLEDTLIFQGNITVTDTLQANEYGGGYGIYKLKVIGSITNNGWVKDNVDTDNPDDLNILITGNITNNGKWTNNYVNFIGTEPQYIEQSPDTKFVSNFYDLNAASAIVANSDITITQDVDLNGSLLDMQNQTLTMSTWLVDGTIKNTDLHGGYIQSVTAIENLTIHGTVTVDDFNAFQCPVIVTDTLRSNTYGGGSKYFDLTIDGAITNNGHILNYDPGHWLRLFISGNIQNNSVWMNYATFFTGENDQEIAQVEGTYFGCDFENQKTGGNIIAGSDLVLMGNFNLNGGNLMMENHSITMVNWLYGGNLDNAILHGGFLQSLTTTTNLVIEGTVTIDDFNQFQCPVIVTDTLRSNTYGGGSKNFDLIIDGSVTNNGHILNYNPGHWLRLYISGDIQNNGEWMDYTTFFTGDNDQEIALASGKYFGGDFESQKTAGNIYGMSDLNFTGNINLSGSTLWMQNFTISLQNFLYNGTIDNATVHGGLLQTITATGQIQIKGTVKVDDNNIFNGPVTVIDTLQSNTYGGGSYYYDVAINNSITNYGVIKSWGSGILRLFVTGDIRNAGEWINYLTYLNGTEDQYVYLIGDAPIDGSVQFDAVLTTAPFQWYHEGTVLDSPDFNGETSQVLSWNIPVQSSWYGTFYCETGEGNSRNIIVQKAMFPAANLQVTKSCTDVLLTWDMSTGGTPDSWNVYRNNQLLAAVTTMSYTDEMLTPEEDYAYYITALYDGQESEPSATETISIPVPDNSIPENFAANAVGTEVNCTWSTPSGCLTPNGYNLYRDNVKINTSLISSLEYNDIPGIGSFGYFVTSVYYFGESEPSSIEIVEITGIDEWIADRIRIYPNPASQILTLSSELSLASVRIASITGQLIITERISADNCVIDVSGFKSGLYFLLVETEKGTIKMKFAVK